MRYLGLDLGTVTLGMSISDTTGTIASTYQTIRFEGNNEQLLSKIVQIIEQEHIGEIVLGLPKNMNNTIGERALITMQFGDYLRENLTIPIHLQDERLSSVAANHYMLEADLSRKKRKQKVDTIAASIILQTYLDTKRGNEQ